MNDLEPEPVIHKVTVTDGADEYSATCLCACGWEGRGWIVGLQKLADDHEATAQ